jgi:hypothetical protein
MDPVGMTNAWTTKVLITIAMMSATTISIGSSRINGLFGCLPDCAFLRPAPAAAALADSPLPGGGGAGSGPAAGKV